MYMKLCGTTIKEYLVEYEGICNMGKPIELRDVLDGNVCYYCSYEDLMEELSSGDLTRVANAQLVGRDEISTKDRLILGYIKSGEEYSQGFLLSVAKKLNDMN